MVYGYARVSTQKQAKDGNSLDDQIQKLREAGAEIIYKDVYTGKKLNRPEFEKLLGKLKSGDKLIVTKLDRFARTAVDGNMIVRQLQENGIVIHILNMGIIDDSSMGKLMTTMLLAFAEFERDMIVERTQTGREIARDNGIKVDGRPLKYKSEQRKLAMELLKNGNTYKQVERMTGISKSTLIRIKRNDECENAS